MSGQQVTESGGGNLAATRAPGAPDALAAYLASLGERSRVSTLHALRRCAVVIGEPVEGVPWHELRHHHVAAIRAKLGDECAPATANASLAALRGVLKSAWRLGLIGGDDYARAVDVRSVPGSRLPAGRALDAGEVSKLLAACDGDGFKAVIAARDKAMIALMLGAGLRRAECVGVEIDDYDGEAVTVIGKGGKERKAGLLGGCASHVDLWIMKRGAGPGRLLRRVSQRGEIEGRGGMAPHTVVSRLVLLSKRAGIEKVTPHDLRRTYITLLLAGGVDLLSVQRLAGHADAATTARYDRRPEQEAVEAAHRIAIQTCNR